ncbi:unnamed protein product [Rhizoctonia solani]|uniref:Uncharacterized protein n=1 Tax=Rhizoctonia solani TaxID=456999 RepID=A0A8H3DXC5_9AGAM|nr:unnamed protein product [Rhizoctonia solani]
MEEKARRANKKIHPSSKVSESKYGGRAYARVSGKLRTHLNLRGAWIVTSLLRNRIDPYCGLAPDGCASGQTDGLRIKLHRMKQTVDDVESTSTWVIVCIRDMMYRVNADVRINRSLIILKTALRYFSPANYANLVGYGGYSEPGLFRVSLGAGTNIKRNLGFLSPDPPEYFAPFRTAYSMAQRERPTLQNNFPTELLDMILRFPDAEDARSAARAHPNFRGSIEGWVPIHVHVPQGDARAGLTNALNEYTSNPKTVILDIDFTHPQSQEDTIQCISEMQRIRYLGLRQYLPARQTVRRDHPERPTICAYPSPLPASLIRDSGGNLRHLTHLELSSLSISFRALQELSQLTHLKLTVTRSHDGYDHYEALQYIRVASNCPMIWFEIGLHTFVYADYDAGNGPQIFQQCVNNWPELKVLNLISDSEGLIPKISGDRPVLGPGFAMSCVQRLREFAPESLKLEQISLGVVPTVRIGTLIPLEGTPAHILDAGVEGPHSLPGLADAFRSACPKLETFRCIIPYINRGDEKGEYYQVVRAVWTGQEGRWQCMREKRGEQPLMVFGKEWEN